jgi:hypothetical protein
MQLKLEVQSVVQRSFEFVHSQADHRVQLQLLRSLHRCADQACQGVKAAESRLVPNLTVLSNQTTKRARDCIEDA